MDSVICGFVASMNRAAHTEHSALAETLADVPFFSFFFFF